VQSIVKACILERLDSYGISELLLYLKHMHSDEKTMYPAESFVVLEKVLSELAS
jgi:hypothetical protein